MAGKRFVGGGKGCTLRPPDCFFGSSLTTRKFTPLARLVVQRFGTDLAKPVKTIIQGHGVAIDGNLLSICQAVSCEPPAGMRGSLEAIREKTAFDQLPVRWPDLCTSAPR